MTTLTLPDGLREQFARKARELYGERGPVTALVEAVEQWLARADQRAIQAERELNNRAYRQMKTELEQKYPGKCVIIAHGAFQAAAESFEELRGVAPTAQHRLAIRIGEVVSPIVTQRGLMLTTSLPGNWESNSVI
ncbi:MAG: hypothetical protein HY023_05260 [Chloroflexi bacterium]|nr:hypothetical protein [Chloroflexota bacterium]MBI3760581.1 hypothetical protein [Chloroflexota bacterium]